MWYPEITDSWNLLQEEIATFSIVGHIILTGRPFNAKFKEAQFHFGKNMQKDYRCHHLLSYMHAPTQ